MGNQLRVFIQYLIAAVFALTVTACIEDDDDSTADVSTDDQNGGDTDADADTDTGSIVEPDPGDDAGDPSAEFTVSGFVKRRGTAKVKHDGIGTLCVAITHSCPGKNNTDPEMLGEGLTIKDADFFAQGAEVPYAITVNTADADLDKRYFVNAIMKEDGGECVTVPGEPVLVIGDMVGMFCGRFKFKGTDVENVNVFLDWTLEQDYH